MTPWPSTSTTCARCARPVHGPSSSLRRTSGATRRAPSWTVSSSPAAPMWGQAPEIAPEPHRSAFGTALYRPPREHAAPVPGTARGLPTIVIAEGRALHRPLPADRPQHPDTGLRPTTLQPAVDVCTDLALAV